MRLPTFQDLSEEQDEVMELPLNGNFLVSGPPGTGKSVMALWRAQTLSWDGREPAILMFNRVLQQYTEVAAAELDIEGSVHTFHAWFQQFWRIHYRTSPPRRGNDQWAYDWNRIMLDFVADPVDQGSLHDLLVDEGQDLPLGFFRLCQYLAANMTVFADENQQIRDENTTLREIEAAIGAEDHLRLTRNYRNTKEIAALAKDFYTGTPTGMPEEPTRGGEVPTLRRFGGLNDFVEWVARYAKAHSDESIGIAVPWNKLQVSLINRLGHRNLPLPVQTYVYNRPEHRHLNFDKPAISIVNYQSVKGLEFDSLLVPELQQMDQDITSAGVRMLFYVIFSRARGSLHLSYSGDSDEPPLVSSMSSRLLERR